MIVVDVNVLVGAYRTDATHHSTLRAWLRGALGEGVVILPVATIVGFIRIVTHPRVFSTPAELPDAIGFINAMLDSRGCWIPETGDRHWPALREELLSGDTRGNLVPDAHLAALARQHGAAVATRDRGFRRFPGIRVVDPVGA